MFSSSSIVICKKELLISYKHIRLKLSSKSHAHKELIDCRINNLSEILDCNSLTAKNIINKHKVLLNIPSEIFIRNAEFCNKHLKFSDIIELPFIISMNSSLLQHRYFSLMELGCYNVTACYILKYPQIVKKTPGMLQKEGILFSTNRLDECLNFLDNDLRTGVKQRLVKMYENGSNLCHIKESMNAEFLGSKMECSLFKTNEMFRKYPPLKVQSISLTNQLLDVLVNDLQISYSKIFQTPHLLSVHHEIVQDVLSQVPTILDVSIIQLLKKLPLLLKRPIDSIKEIDNILKNFNISNDQLLCCPKILTFTPSTLQERLKKLSVSEDFSLLKSYKKFLWLAYHYSDIDTRLQRLKQHDIPYSISMFTISKGNFDKYFSMSECRSHIKDMCFYLAKVFGTTEGEMHQKLKEYPTLHNSSLSNCAKIIEFLLNAGVTKQQILNGIGIIFYDHDIVKMYFQELPTYPECQPFSDWLNHYNLIQLLIYKIEVDANFRGTTLFKVKGKSDDLEELSISTMWK